MNRIIIKAVYVALLVGAFVAPGSAAEKDTRVLSGIGFDETKTLACWNAKQSLRNKFDSDHWKITSLGPCDCSQSSATERWGCTIDGTVTER